MTQKFLISAIFLYVSFIVHFSTFISTIDVKPYNYHHSYQQIVDNFIHTMFKSNV